MAQLMLDRIEFASRGRKEVLETCMALPARRCLKATLRGFGVHDSSAFAGGLDGGPSG